MATVSDLRKWLAGMPDDYTVYTDYKGDLCCDSHDCRVHTYRFYPDRDDTNHASWYWANYLSQRPTLVSEGGE
jgi:hypothetical protein